MRLAIIALMILCLTMAIISPLASATAPEIATWTFSHPGFYPRHLPDTFTGTIDVNDLTPPSEIQAIYKFDDESGLWLFWSPEAPGTTLDYLEGGTQADYMVTTIGACAWEIDLSYLGMTRAQLLIELEDGNVADDWWSLEDSYRRELGVRITQWFSADTDSKFGADMDWVVEWPTKPDWLPRDYPDGYNGARRATCAPESGVRYCLIGGQYQPTVTTWYYTLILGPPMYADWFPVNQSKPFLLPVAHAGAMGAPGSGYPGHWLLALQVGEDKSRMDSWIFFQYHETDIKPGNTYQMPRPGWAKVTIINHVGANAVAGGYSNGSDWWYERFDYLETGDEWYEY